MANPPPPRMPAPPKKPLAPWRRKLGRSLPWLVAATVVALLIQVYLAGAGLLGDGSLLETHELFANAVIRLLFALLLLLGFLGADPKVGIVGLVLTVLLELQYPLIGAEAGEVRGLHAANGALMLSIAVGTFMARLPWRPAADAGAAKPPASVPKPLPPQR